MPHARRLLAVASLAAAALVSGCATFNAMQPMPPQKEAVAVTVSDEPPSAMNEMPIGVYQVSNGALYISGHQQGQAAGMLFGLLGVAIAHGANQEAGRQRVQSAEAALKTALAEAARGRLAEKMQQSHGPKPLAAAGTQGAATLEVQPFVVLTYVSDARARPYVILKARLLDTARQELWWTRYVTAVAEDRPVDGADGWAASQGEPLRRAVARGLDVGLDLLLKDVAGALPRATDRKVKVKGRYAFVRTELELEGDLLEETPDRIVFAPRVGDVVVFAGLNVFDKGSVQITPATK